MPKNQTFGETIPAPDHEGLTPQMATQIRNAMGGIEVLKERLTRDREQ